ncbi:hypothetical protein KR026_009846 [Drosophila bipectinata]|nr:hypothetical protein KR026_009846 [Drosophila bipectinata]
MSRAINFDADLEVNVQGGDNNSVATTATLEERPGKPKVRFFSIGPNSSQVRCPLCQKNAKIETLDMGGCISQLTCVLSTLSLCFPFFALACVYYSCLQGRLKTKRAFCSKCGGHLGFHWRPV